MIVPTTEVFEPRPPLYLLPAARVSDPCENPSSITVPTVCSVPPFRLVSVPPWIVELTFTVPALAVIWPFRLLTPVEICRAPPLVASSSPALVMFPPPFRSRVWPETLALIVPAALLTTVSPP